MATVVPNTAPDPASNAVAARTGRDSGGDRGEGVSPLLAFGAEKAAVTAGKAGHGVEGVHAVGGRPHDLPSRAGPPVDARVESRRCEAALPAGRAAPGSC